MSSNPANNPTLRPDELPETFGRYQILGRLGRGGMGAVYRAWDPALEREVALKVPLNVDPADRDVMARFQREARAAAALHHPHICSVFDVGQVNGLPFFTLQLIRGETLAELVERGDLLIPERGIELCGKIAAALQHAHDNGVLHRDLKPSNVMLDYAGNPHVMDFGLSRRIDQDEALTADGQLLGTPAYMAPEQARGQMDRLGPATDVYGLGAILFELLTGRRPFTRKGAGVLLDVLEADPPSPSELRPELDPRLDDICRKALAKRPEDRYATAAEMAAALQSLLQPAATVVTKPARRIAAYAAAAAAIAVAALTVYAARRSPENTGLSDDSVASAASDDARPGMADDEAPPLPPPQQPAAHRPNMPPMQQPVAAREVVAQADSPVASTPSRPEPAGENATDASATASPEEAVALLRKYCHRCHGAEFAAPRLDVLDREALTAVVAEGETPFITPGQPDESLLWQRAGLDGDMPPEEAEQPTNAEREILAHWIRDGAPFPAARARPFLDWRHEFAVMRDHLRRTEADIRPYQRYFTLTHLHNDPAVTADMLAASRAALSKAVNSLSWRPDIMLPQAVDAEKTIFVIDLRDFDWHEGDVWSQVLAKYPYGLNHEYAADAELQQAAKEVYDLAHNPLPHLRADWFIATAMRPPLYQVLLELPGDVRTLERQLDVDAEADFRNNRLARAGFSKSGVSDQNRLVDRHRARYGAYWKSYDFGTNDGRGHLAGFPLGPDFPGHPFPDQAFHHDGGEMIFTLPNGLHGYYLADDAGRLIDAGPIEVVSDSLKTSGTPAIVNGLSCMACHKAGTIELQDHLRQGAAVFGEARAKVEQLFRPREEMDHLLREDREAYLRALAKAIGPALDGGFDPQSPPEPIGAVARRYQQDLSLADVARELNIADPEELRSRIMHSRELRKKGLGPLLDGGYIDRSLWSSLDVLPSVFQAAAKELELGTPQVSF